ncbi:MYB DNA binding protein [Paecilomyces variotii No. 5]|uniref:MYB DNA binding protein n=1 Tax=Byssochlamys spectabilis (strain No. 5 / NBRC 109023) TaxID=1356009 RepID=V5FHE8_BYSSN|nr:MYB DNA binding protein [Paecilomyces variotii No. 5]
MVSTRGSRLSSDGKTPSAFPTSSMPDENNEFGKISHSLDDDDGSLSPRAYKKRRTSGPDAFDASSFPTKQENDVTAGNQIEDELASLDTGPLEAGENLNGSQDQGEGGTDNGAVPAGNPDPAQDVAAVISNIIGHSERVEEQFAASQQEKQETNDAGAPASKGVVYLKANSHLKIQSLPILDNLSHQQSTQILTLLAKSSYQDITSFVSEPDSENGQAYATMRSLFDHTKRVYSTKTAFLSPTELDLTEPSQVDIIRKANLASFVSSIFGTQDISFAELNDHFLDVFVPEGSRLLKVQGALFLELKTQAFIASMNSQERTRTELLYDLFPEDLEQRLLSKRPGTRQLAPSEADFVKRARSRRDILLGEINNEEAVKALPEKYHWEDFLRDLSSYISKNFDAINNQQTKKTAKGRQPSTSEAQEQQPSAPLETQFSVAPQPPEVPVDRNVHGDLVARAARAAQIALQGHGLRRSQQSQQQQQNQQQQHQHQQHAQQQHQQPQQTQQMQQTQQQHSAHGTPVPQPPPPQHGMPLQQQFQGSPTPPAYHQQSQQPQQLTFQQSPLQANFQQYNPAANAASITARANAAAANYGYMPGVPHYSQSQPTQILYERARMAATAKSSPSSRRAGLPSQRRPWTTEEENALMAGLDRVKGPHWSQILAMFGPGGTINESLKDRNQVQLKDKARNLKLFFLKSGIEVPYYLKFVTGELKTRAPAQAAKNEAREREKKRGEEDKAHVEGIEGMMALAGAHAPHIAPGPGQDNMSNMSGSPGLPQDADNHAMMDQTAEQNLMQTLGQEVHGDLLQQTQHQDPVDPNMQLGQ